MFVLQQQDRERHREDVRGKYGQDILVLLHEVPEEHEEPGTGSEGLQMDQAEGLKTFGSSY